MKKKIADIDGYVRKLKTDFENCIRNFTELQKKFNYQVKIIAESTTANLYIISNDVDICIKDVDNQDKWFKIVCNINNECKQNETWITKWRIEQKGFSLISMLKNSWKGWHGQYEKSELRYDELPRDVLNRHHNRLVEHIKTLGIWYPCHIYNDFTGDLYRP